MPHLYLRFFLKVGIHHLWRRVLCGLTFYAVSAGLVAELLEEESAAVLAPEDLSAGQLARADHLGAGRGRGPQNLPDPGPTPRLQHLGNRFIYVHIILMTFSWS